MSITQYLTEEHRKCDTYYAEAEKAVSQGEWEKAKELFNTFKEKTLLHFRKEEDVLFPEFEQRTGIVMGPTQVMRMEHDQARQLLERMEQALQNQNKDEFLSLGESLMILLQQHNMKEEQILYPMSDQNLDSESMVVKMSELGEV
ncbi:MAG: hemerythrin domain-containing protein [Aquificae bacterium]|nr:hemerythrin domain-containing protein [Aquificota bacterium]